MTDGQRPKTPPPFPTPSEVQIYRADTQDPAVAALIEKVNAAFKASPNSEGAYVVYIASRGTTAAVTAVTSMLEDQGWIVEYQPGVCNDADLIIRPGS